MSKDDLNGDEEFQNFLDKENIPIENHLDLIIKTIEKKAKTVIKFYNSSLNFYKSLKEDDPLKKVIQEFIINLIDNSLHILNQYDYALIDSEPDEDENEEEGDDEKK